MDDKKYYQQYVDEQEWHEVSRERMIEIMTGNYNTPEIVIDSMKPDKEFRLSMFSFGKVTY